MDRNAKKKRSKFQICRRILMGILVLLLIATTASILVPQYEIWKGEHEREQVVLTWLDEVRVQVPPSSTDPTEASGVVPDTTESTGQAASANNGVRYTDLYNDIKAYNEKTHADGQAGLRDVFDYEVPTFDLSDYGVKDDMFGAISIPKINVILPLYLGATYRHMNDGFAQMSNTSIPIGGESTNSVIACHRGWNRMAYLRDVEMLDIGDTVYVHNLWEDLEYRVVDIYIVKPSNLSILEIQEGRDLLTLFTCHPYGVSTHRYVVVCERYIPDATELPADVESESGTAPTEPHVLMTSADVKSNVTHDSATYVTKVIQSVTVTTTNTSEGTVESSQQILFWTVYFPWMLLGVLLILIIIYTVCSAIRYGIRKAKRKKAKPTLRVRVM